MPKEQMLMGLAVSALSLVAFWKTDWLLCHTRKGEWFVRRLGDRKARGIVRAFFFLATIFGALLAADVIRPVQW